MPVSVVVLVLEVADDHPGLEQGVPTLFSQNRCSASETNSGPLSIRSTLGGPPAAVNTLSRSATSRSAVRSVH
jgi:hypothetical protein